MNFCFITPIKNRLLLSLLLIVLSGSRLLAAAPTISSFSPHSGPIAPGPTGGTEVTINGTGFSTTASENTVLFGTIKAPVVSSTNTQLTVWAPKGFSHERITVQVNNLSVTSTQYFLVTSTYECALTQHSFETKVDFTEVSSPSSICVGDIDGDGKTDLVVGALSTGSVTIYKNKAFINNPIEPGSFDNITINLGGDIAMVLLEDMDGDGKPDLVVSKNSSSEILILTNTSSTSPYLISFGTVATLNINNTVKKFALADLDYDGKPEIITANSAAASTSVLRNISTVGNMSFATPVLYYLDANPESVITGDLTMDGRPEIIVTHSQSNEITILRNKGSLGGFNALSFGSRNTLSTNGTKPTIVKLADFNKDGLLDIVAINQGSNATNRSIAILKNTFVNTTTSFSNAINFPLPGQPSDVAIGDFNGDDKPDLAVSIYLNNTVALYSNSITGSNIDATAFSTPVSYPTGVQPVSLCIADFDGDGKADLATVNGGGGMSVVRRVFQEKPYGSMVNNSGASQVTTCPSTETLIKVRLKGRSPWTIIYQIGGPFVTQKVIGITGTEEFQDYLFTVSPEESTTYRLTYVSDAQQCNTFEPSSQIFATVNIIPTPVLTPKTIPHGTLGSPYNQTLILDPGTPPSSWSVSGELPTALTFANGVITGTPTEHNTYSFTVTAAFTDCPAIRQYHMLCTDNSTTWNGTSWSNGVPTSSKDAIIDGNYNTAVNGVFSCFHLAVNESDTLFIKGTNTITASGNAINNGAIYKDCSAALSITGTFAGQAVKILQPQILPAFLSNGLVNLPYSQALRVSIGESPTYTFAGTLPTGLSLTNGIIAGTPNKTGRYDFSIHSTENSGLCEASGNFSIIIETADPTLKFPANGITKYTGTARFKYAPTTKSNGTITYSIEPANGCATIDANDTITITCGEPIKQYTITAIQAADYIYKADTATTILTIEKSKPELRFAKTGYVLGSTTGNTIQYQTNSTGTVSIFQVNNSNVAIVNMAGAVVPVAAGTFDILLKIAETPNFLPNRYCDHHGRLFKLCSSCSCAY